MIFSITKINAYIKSKEEKTKWQQKKNNNLFSQRGAQGAKNTILGPLPKPNYTLESIGAKMRAGKRLSPGEMAYLRENNPEMYEKALKTEREREEYRRRLKQCRTREEARALRLHTAAGFLSEVRSGTSQDDIQSRSMAISDEHTAFVQSPQYKELPENEHEYAQKKKSGAHKPAHPHLDKTLYGKAKVKI